METKREDPSPSQKHTNPKGFTKGAKKNIAKKGREGKPESIISLEL
jgi:hypothetical protein